MGTTFRVKCVNVKEGCPKKFILGEVFSPNSKSTCISKCCSGGGYYQGYEVECLLCGETWETST